MGEIGLSRASISSLFISSIVFQFELLISTNIALTTSTSLNASLGLGHFTTLKLFFFRGETQAEEKRFQRRTDSFCGEEEIEVFGSSTIQSRDSFRSKISETT